MSDSEDKKVNCVICRKEFKRTAGAKDHIRRVHQNVGRVCNLGANCDRSRFKNRKCEVGKVIYTNYKNWKNIKNWNITLVKLTDVSKIIGLQVPQKNVINQKVILKQELNLWSVLIVSKNWEVRYH